MKLTGFEQIDMKTNNLFLKKNDKNLIIDDYIIDVINQQIPDGLIVKWSGLWDKIPDGWLLCDGTNGTPDLTNKFILGATPETTHNVGGNRFIQIKWEN
jgi:hypothetical protein